MNIPFSGLGPRHHAQFSVVDPDPVGSETLSESEKNHSGSGSEQLRIRAAPDPGSSGSEMNLK
jgi:hypothetical protein